MILAKILYVDDRGSARELFARQMNPQKYEVAVAASVVEAETILQAQKPDVIITDLLMPDVDGLEGLARFQKIDPDIPVVLITAFGTVETAVEAMK
ncbi:MAG: response regulator, partial [Deltaproteobacteria bacterium]|nr:response regulator [Deltaproteobacteria bacterium]